MNLDVRLRLIIVDTETLLLRKFFLDADEHLSRSGCCTVFWARCMLSFLVHHDIPLNLEVEANIQALDIQLKPPNSYRQGPNKIARMMRNTN